MKVTILGCGSSGGVPLVGNEWGTCDPKEPRNRRTRASIVVENRGQTILVDTSPDLRQQLLDCDLKALDAVLYTHAHADHCHGIDELRGINWLTQKPVEIYADSTTMQELQNRFPYIFRATKTGEFYKPVVNLHPIDGSFLVGQQKVISFVQDHGFIKSLGFRFEDFAYSTDVKALDQDAFKALEGIKLWVVDCVREEPHPTHAHLALTLEWIERLKPERAYLTHMSHLLDYETLSAKLPVGVMPAYDGLVLEC